MEIITFETHVTSRSAFICEMQPGELLPSYALVEAQDIHLSARRKGSGSCLLIPNQIIHIRILRSREHAIAPLGNEGLNWPWESQDPVLFY